MVCSMNAAADIRVITHVGDGLGHGAGKVDSIGRRGVPGISDAICADQKKKKQGKDFFHGNDHYDKTQK